jgi:hypothetical protein
MNETKIPIPVKCRFPATKSKEVERKRSEQSNAGQGKARQSRERTGQEGTKEMKFLGVSFDRQGAPCIMPSVAHQWICQNPEDNLMMEPDLVTWLG